MQDFKSFNLVLPPLKNPHIAGLGGKQGKTYDSTDLDLEADDYSTLINDACDITSLSAVHIQARDQVYSVQLQCTQMIAIQLNIQR